MGGRRTAEGRGGSGGRTLPAAFQAGAAVALVGVAFAAGHVARVIASPPPRVESAPTAQPAPQVVAPITPSEPPSPEKPPSSSAPGLLAAVVRTDGGVPLPGVKVRWEEVPVGAEAARVVAETKTGEDGRAIVEGALPRDVELLVRLPAGVAEPPEPEPVAVPPLRRGRSEGQCRLDVVLPDGTTTTDYRCAVTYAGGSRSEESDPDGNRWITTAGTLWVCAGPREEFVAGPIRIGSPLPSRLRVETRRIEGAAVDLVAAGGFDWIPLRVRARNADGVELDVDGRPPALRSFGDVRPPGALSLTPGEYEVGASHDGVAWSTQRLRVGEASDETRIVAAPPDPRSILTVEVLGADGARVPAKFRWQTKRQRMSFSREAKSRRLEDGRYLVFRGNEASVGESSSEAQRWLVEAQWTLEVDEGGGGFEVEAPVATTEVTARVPTQHAVQVRVEGPGWTDLGDDVALEVRCARETKGPRLLTGSGVKCHPVASDGTAVTAPLGEGRWYVALVAQGAMSRRILGTTEIDVREGAAPVVFHVPKLHSLRVEAGRGASGRMVGIRPADCGWDVGTYWGLDASGTWTFDLLLPGRHEVTLQAEGVRGFGTDATRTVSVPETKVLRWE